MVGAIDSGSAFSARTKSRAFHAALELRISLRSTGRSKSAVISIEFATAKSAPQSTIKIV